MRGIGRRRFAFLTLGAAVLCLAAAPGAQARDYPNAPRFHVGFAQRDINPDPDGTWHGEPVNLGGYGLGGPPLFEGRAATGVLGRGADVRAFVVTRRGGALAIASEQTQGWFAALKRGEPHGLQDMRVEVERRTQGGLPAESVIVQSNHTHSGPDMMGVWGGVPRDYRRYVFERTVDAIVSAFEHRRSAVLRYGEAPARDLLTNQFEYDAANESVDSDLRVLQAIDPRSGDALATLLNFSAHATVLGASNTKVSGDWPQLAAPMLERRIGGRVAVTVATLGRTQPADRGCPDESLGGDAESLCSLREYSGRVVHRAVRAIRSSRPVGGPPRVRARSYLITDIATNPLLLGFEYAGDLIGTPLNRAATAPWFVANLLSTTTASARVGDLLISAYPGEAYPQIPLDVAAAVEGIRGQMTLGLANDQLGYLIAPLAAYPEPIRRSLFNERGDEISPIDNDNYFFNVSHTIGEGVRCSSLRGAGAVLGLGRRYLNRDPSCLPYSLDSGRPHGADLP